MSKSKIVAIHNNDEDACLPETGPRQLALKAGKVTMIVEFYLVVDTRQGLKGKELKGFMNKYEALNRDEILDAIQVPEEEFMRILNQVIECIGCRRMIERAFQQFKRSDSRTLDPIYITKEGVIRIRQEELDNNFDICKMLQKSILLFSDLATLKQKTKQGIRCTIHNMDAYKVTPFSEAWITVWDSMKNSVREKMLIIDMEDLQTTLDVYLKKHKFCHECSAKVETAFHLLFKEKNPKKEPGYSDELYAGIKRCLNKHIQLPCKVDFIDNLIRRAEPELVGNGSRQRERHAKNLQIAQEEVLTCIGMCIFERFRRVYHCRREEEGACQLLSILALHGMYQSFDLAVERKRGISNLELLYEEIAQEEQRQEHKKEQKKLKKRQKKMEKRSLCSNCKSSHHKHDHEVHDAEVEETEELKEEKPSSCRSKRGAKGNSGCNSDMHGKVFEEDHENEPEDEDDGDDEEFMLQMRVRELELRKSGSKANLKAKNNNSGGNQNKKPVTGRGGGTDKVADKVAVNQKKNKIDKETPEATATRKQKDNSCKTCDSPTGKRPALPSQPISVDCGYVSDQLSLTNCSSTSSSSIDDGKAPPAVSASSSKSPISEVPCSSSSPLTINSQLSSLSSSPEGSEVACQDGLCNHVVLEATPPTMMMMETGLQVATAAQPARASNVSTLAGSYIPEEQINEFRSRHHNLKAVREELRKNLRQNFAQFCLENKNRPLSHLCRTGKCLNNGSLDGLCSGDCE